MDLANTMHQALPGTFFSLPVEIFLLPSDLHQKIKKKEKGKGIFL